MTLIDSYLHEVSKKLHKNTRREEILLDLKATIENMLPEQYSESDVKTVLQKLGNPVKIAASYQDTPRFLIGPDIFDQYIGTIKLVIPWAMFMTIIIQVIKKIVLFAGEEALLTTIISTFSMIIVAVISVFFHVLFWITVVFIIVERSGSNKIQLPFLNAKQWSPDDLVKIKNIPKDKVITLSDTIFSLSGIFIFAFVYWNAYRLLGIYTTNDNGSLKFVMPIFNQNILQTFAPIVFLCIILSVVLTFVKWRSGQWTMPIAITNALLQGGGTVVFIALAMHQDFIHSASIPYIATITDTASAKVTFFIDKILLLGMITAVLVNAFDIYQGFRKAKM